MIFSGNGEIHELCLVAIDCLLVHHVFELIKQFFDPCSRNAPGSREKGLAIAHMVRLNQLLNDVVLGSIDVVVKRDHGTRLREQERLSETGDAEPAVDQNKVRGVTSGKRSGKVVIKMHRVGIGTGSAPGACRSQIHVN